MTTKNFLFSIRNLVCSYNQVHPVLFIPDLDIHPGEICVLFGKSGSGKSTLLETLGLMTNTLAYNKVPYQILSEIEQNPELLHAQTQLAFNSEDAKGSDKHTIIDKSISSFKFQPRIGNKPIEPESKWNNPKQLSQLRLRHFAFIFQKTNLMPNFTAEENVAIVEMYSINKNKCNNLIKDCPYLIDKKSPGKYNEGCNFSLKECSLRHARHTLCKIGIQDMHFQKPVKKLSGGQQQRIAFARAINASFSVIFGDEPTGNLDKKNSEVIMEKFRDKIANKQDLKTSVIIVTHSIELSLEFADRIVLIDMHRYKLPNHIAEQLDEEYRDNGSFFEYGKINADKVFFSRVENGSRQWFKGEDSRKDEVTMRKELSDHLSLED